MPSRTHFGPTIWHTKDQKSILFHFYWRIVCYLRINDEKCVCCTVRICHLIETEDKVNTTSKRWQCKHFADCLINLSVASWTIWLHKSQLSNQNKDDVIWNGNETKQKNTAHSAHTYMCCLSLGKLKKEKKRRNEKHSVNYFEMKEKWRMHSNRTHMRHAHADVQFLIFILTSPNWFFYRKRNLVSFWWRNRTLALAREWQRRKNHFRFIVINWEKIAMHNIAKLWRKFPKSPMTKPKK